METGDEEQQQQQQGAVPRSSMRALVGSDEAMRLILDCLGPFGDEKGEDGWTFVKALALGRALPGVCIVSPLAVGPAGTKLLEADITMGGLWVHGACSWPHVLSAIKLNAGVRKLRLWFPLRPGDVELLVEALSANSTVEELDLSCLLLGEAGGTTLATWLAANTTLRGLNLDFCRLGDSGVRSLAAALLTNGALRELNLNRSNFGVLGGRALGVALAANATLLKLDLSDSRLDDEAAVSIAAALEANLTIRELNLRYTRLCKAAGAALASALRQNRTLQVLDLGHSQEPGLGAGMGWSQLVLSALEQNDALHTLRMEQCGLAPGDGLALAASLSERTPRNERAGHNERTGDMNHKMRGLALARNPDLGDDACAAILDSVCLGPGSLVRDLCMTQTGTGPKTLSSLAGVLGANSSLRVLELGDVNVGDDDGDSWRKLFAALAVNAGLRRLALTECNFGQDDIEALAAALRTNRVLREVDLSSNGRIGPDAVCALASALRTNSTLHELVLNLTAPGDAGALALATALQTNTALRKLALGSVQGILGDAAKKTLQAAARAAGCTIEF